MERAIDVMKQSIHEPRKDGKATPSVGAVLWKPDGTVETAYRGELRDGDHAEFTLLERKNRQNALDDCVLFATLEPCSEKARKPPKTCCARRIIDSRIRRVWVGIQDPDPNVANEGVQLLLDAGVDVQMFDRDLQEIIEKENRKFLDEAMERAQLAKEQMPEVPKVSVLDRPVAAATMNDLDLGLLDTYRRRLGIDGTVDSKGFMHHLELQGFVVSVEAQLVPTGAGIVLFGRHPRLALAQAGLLAEIRYADGTLEEREFGEAALLIPELALNWLRDKLPNVVDRARIFRERIPPLPEILLRESIVNALVHRDYDLVGPKCQLIVTPDTVTIRSPGEPPRPISIDQLADFSAPSVSRNPRLHFVFAKMRLAEERNWGLGSIREELARLDLPMARFRWHAPFVELTFFRYPESATRVLPSAILDRLGAEERAAWQYLSKQATITRADYQKHFDLDARTAQRQLKAFVELKLLEVSGAGPSTSYKVRQP